MKYQEIISSEITLYTEGAWAYTSISPSSVFMNCDKNNKNPNIGELLFAVTQTIDGERVKPVFVTEGDAIIDAEHTIAANGKQFTFIIVDNPDDPTTLYLRVSTQKDAVFDQEIYQAKLKFRCSDSTLSEYFEHCYIVFNNNEMALSGIDGAGLVYLGPWESTHTYVLNNVYRECVSIEQEVDGVVKKVYYMSLLCVEKDPSKRGVKDTIPFSGINPVEDINNLYWLPFEGQFKSVATELLLAEDAVFGTANTTKLWIGYKGSFNNEGQPVDITKADGWVMDAGAIKTIRRISNAANAESAVELSASGAIILRDADSMVLTSGLYSSQGEGSTGSWSIDANGIARFNEVYANNLNSIAGWDSAEKGLEWFEGSSVSDSVLYGDLALSASDDATGIVNNKTWANGYLNEDGTRKLNLASGYVTIPTTAGVQVEVLIPTFTSYIKNWLDKNNRKYLVTNISYVLTVKNGETIVHQESTDTKRTIHGIDSQKGALYRDSLSFAPFTIATGVRYSVNISICFTKDKNVTDNGSGSNDGYLYFYSSTASVRYSSISKSAKLYHDELFMGYEDSDQFRVYYDENNDLKIKLKGDLEIDGDIIETVPGTTGKIHVHENLPLLQTITQADIDKWNAANELFNRNFEEVGDNIIKAKKSIASVADIAAYGASDSENPGGGSGGGASTLDELIDVIAPNPSAGDLLMYNGDTWVNVSSITITAGKYSII